MGRYTSKKARSFKRTQSCVSSCAKSKFWVFVRNESCPSDETSLVSSIWCFSSNFTGAIKAARILWQSLTLFYSKGEGKYKARKRKIKPWLILKTLLLKEQGYSQVTNAIFQLMNFSFLVNVSVIFFFFTFKVWVVQMFYFWPQQRLHITPWYAPGAPFDAISGFSIVTHFC